MPNSKSQAETKADSEQKPIVEGQATITQNPMLNAGAVTLLQPIKPKIFGCLCCGSNVQKYLPMDTVLYMGFGGWRITKNNELFYMGDTDLKWEQFKILADIEKNAKHDAKSDWRAVCDTPLHGQEFQRQRGKWVLVKQNSGFA